MGNKRSHAPEGGYDFQAKQEEYREPQWRWIDRQLAHKVIKKRRTVAYLETRHGVETRYLLKRGYNPHNLHAVNIEPVEMALLTSGLKADGLPTVNTHGIDFARTLLTAGVSHWHVMSFDGCGPISSSNTLRCIKKMAALANPGSILCANVLAGRDSGEAARLLKETKSSGEDTHARRWLWLEKAFTTVLHDGRVVVRWTIASKMKGIYTSASRQPMLWLAARVAPPPHGGSFKEFRDFRILNYINTGPTRPPRSGTRRELRDVVGAIKKQMIRLTPAFELLKSKQELERNGFILGGQAQSSFPTLEYDMRRFKLPASIDGAGIPWNRIRQLGLVLSMMELAVDLDEAGIESDSAPSIVARRAELECQIGSLLSST